MACTFDLTTIERMVLDGLKTHLTDPVLIATYVETYNEERRRLAAGHAREHLKAQRRLAQIEREIARAVDWIVTGSADKGTLGPKLKAMEAEKRDLSERLAEPLEGEVVALHPGAIAHYRTQVEDLHTALAAGDLTGSGAVDAFRALVSTVIVGAKAEGLQIELRGRLAELTGAPAFPEGVVWGNSGSGGGTRTPDTRIMIPLL